MENLKVTFNFENYPLLNRYLTIDNLLLSIYYGKKTGRKFVKTEEDLENISKWLEVKNDTISGSIWYIEDDENDIVLPQNDILVKTINDKKYLRETDAKRIDKGRGEFKAYRIGFERLTISSVYFYVRGDKEYIEKLLGNIRFIGKKISLGFGRVKDYKVEVIDTDKSFMLDRYTPSKPLPVSKWKIDSKKIAFYRSLPPYYLREGVEPCYMPTRSLVEREDKSRLNKKFKAVIIDYISPAKFARIYSGFENIDLYEEFSNKRGLTYTYNNTSRRCIVCGSIEREGVVGNPKNILPKTFNDYAFLSQGDFICKDCLWSMKSEKVLGNTLISKKGTIYVQGNKMKIKGAKKQQEFRSNLFKNLDLLEPPFLISLKSTPNSQHTVFKNKVSISNAMVPISFGTEEEVLIDVELLKEAVEEAKKIIEDNECIKKLHLINHEQIDEVAPILSKRCRTQDNFKIISNFYKKYDRSIRKILNRIIF